MNNINYKSPFVFFSIVFIVALAGLIYLYFYKNTSTSNIFWVDASLKVTTDWGSCSSAFPCYETFITNQDGNVYHNGEIEGRLSGSKIKEVINKSYTLYKSGKCTPSYESDVTQEYELNIDGSIYEFGGERGCKEMNGVFNILVESINN